MNLEDYLARIGFAGAPRPDLATLSALVAAHVESVPFENLDVQRRRPVTLAAEDAFAKVVGRRRGGWCYELNGLFGWALGEIGFAVRRLGAGVLVDRLGESQRDTHLCLLVTLDAPYLVDVGFGSSLAAPLPLREGERMDAPFTVGLQRVGDGWRFVERLGDGEPFTFDFTTAPADEARLLAASDRQQTDPDSPFRRRLVAQRRSGDAHLSLRGDQLTRATPDGATTEPVAVAATLRDIFGIDADDM